MDQILKIKLGREVKDYLAITFGLICYALGWAAFLLPYQRKCRKPFFLYGCFRGSRPTDHKSAKSSVVLFPVCICFKNQRTDSDKDTEGIASYYIKYPHCTHSDSLCQGSWFPQGKQ